MKTIGENIECFYKERGMTIEEVAEKTGVCVLTIKNILRNESTPSKKTLKNIAKALGVKVNELYPEGTVESISCQDVGGIIKRLCLERGITYKELADMAGITRYTVYYTIKGKHKMRNTTLELIAEALDIGVEELCPEK